MESAYLACFAELAAAEKAVVLTGAGVSTLSGIPDFRGRSGMYRSTWHGISRETLLEIGFFRRYPEIFYRFAAEELYPMLDKEPSIAHTVLARLQRRGAFGRLYTQNIDDLHNKAGAASCELHGTLALHRCLECGRSFPLDEVRLSAADGKVPRCSCGGLVKPEVVFYGEMLNEALLEQAFQDFETADFALVLGSSLAVTPVASLPAQLRRGRGRLVIVNEQPTPYDREAAFRFPDIGRFCKAAGEYPAWQENG